MCDCLRDNQQGTDRSRSRQWAGTGSSSPPLLCALPAAQGLQGEPAGFSGPLLLGSEMPPTGFRRRNASGGHFYFYSSGRFWQKWVFAVDGLPSHCLVTSFMNVGHWEVGSRSLTSGCWQRFPNLWRTATGLYTGDGSSVTFPSSGASWLTSLRLHQCFCSPQFPVLNSFLLEIPKTASASYNEHRQERGEGGPKETCKAAGNGHSRTTHYGMEEKKFKSEVLLHYRGHRYAFQSHAGPGSRPILILILKRHTFPHYRNNVDSLQKAWEIWKLIKKEIKITCHDTWATPWINKGEV